MGRVWTWVCAVALVAAVLPAWATAASVEVKAAIDLDAAPGWQSDVQKNERGSWVKHASPTVADLDPGAGNGPEILVASQGGKLYALRYRNGSLTKVWDSGAAIDTFIDSTPAVADLDGDGCAEVLVGAGNEFRAHRSGVHVFDCRGQTHRFWGIPGHAKPNHVGVFSSPAVGDVDGDGVPDVAFGSFNQKIYVKHRTGADLPGWEGGKEMHDTVWSSAALADVDGDGRHEVMIGNDLGGGASVFGCPRPTRGMLSLYDERGAFMPGFPKCLDTPIWSSPGVADLDGNGTLDVVVGTNNYLENGGPVGEPWKVRAWNTIGGGDLWTVTFPHGHRIFSSPAIGDVTGDGKPEVAIASVPPDNFGQVWLIDGATGGVLWKKEGVRHPTCACVFMGTPTMADVTGDGRAEVVVAGGDGHLSAWDAGGHPVIDDLDVGSHILFNSPAVTDLDGDGRNEIVLASAAHGVRPLRGKVWVLSTPGTGTGPWPMFRRTADGRGVTGVGPSTGGGDAPAPGPASSTPRRRSPPSRSSPASAPAATAASPTPTVEPTLDPTASPRRTRQTDTAAIRPRQDDTSGGAAAGAAVGTLLLAGAALAVARVRQLL